MDWRTAPLDGGVDATTAVQHARAVASAGGSRGMAWMSTLGDASMYDSRLSMSAAYTRQERGQYMDIDMVEAGDSDTDYSSSDDEPFADGDGGGEAGAGGGWAAGISEQKRSVADELGSATYCDLVYLQNSGVEVSSDILADKRKKFQNAAPQEQRRAQQQAFGPSIDDVLPQRRPRTRANADGSASVGPAAAATTGAQSKDVLFYGDSLDDEDEQWMKGKSAYCVALVVSEARVFV